MLNILLLNSSLYLIM